MTSPTTRAARHDSVPILMYHSLDDSGSVVSVAPAAFAAHMAALSAAGWTGIRLDTLLAAWDTGAALPEHPVVLTFDDAYSNVLEHGVPVLNELGFGATLFVITEWCGRTSAWPGQGDVAPVLPIMSWEELGRAAEAGLELGAHTLDHPRLPALSPEATEVQIAGSRDALRSRLDVDAATFAYPYGLVSPAGHAVARRLFAGAVSVRHGRARRTNDRHLLPRLDAYYLRGSDGMAGLLTRRGRLTLGLCGVLRGLRSLATKDRATD